MYPPRARPAAPPPWAPPWALTLFITAFSFTRYASGLRVHEGNLRDLLSTSESIALTGNGEDAEFALVRPQIQSAEPPWRAWRAWRQPERHRRSADAGAGAELEVTVPAEGLGRHFQLRLRRSAPLLDPHFALLLRHHNYTEPLLDGLAEREARCLYRGTGPRGERAAMHMCDTVTRGVIFDGDPEGNGRQHYYLLQSLPERLVRPRPPSQRDAEGDPQRGQHDSEGATHVLLKRSLFIPELPVSDLEDDLMEPASVCGLRRDARGSGAPALDRRRREAAVPAGHMLPTVYIETAVFVDRDLLQHMALNFPTDTEREVVRFVLAMVNAVQLLYESPSLGRPVKLALKRLELLHTEPAGLRRSHDIDRFLSSFCAWQANSNPGDDAHPLHWDHALILTGLDLYVVGKGGKVSSQVVGTK